MEVSMCKSRLRYRYDDWLSTTDFIPIHNRLSSNHWPSNNLPRDASALINRMPFTHFLPLSTTIPVEMRIWCVVLLIFRRTLRKQWWIRKFELVISYGSRKWACLLMGNWDPRANGEQTASTWVNSIFAMFIWLYFWGNRNGRLVFCEISEQCASKWEKWAGKRYAARLFSHSFPLRWKKGDYYRAPPVHFLPFLAQASEERGSESRALEVWSLHFARSLAGPRNILGSYLNPRAAHWEPEIAEDPWRIRSMRFDANEQWLPSALARVKTIGENDEGCPNCNRFMQVRLGEMAFWKIS